MRHISNLVGVIHAGVRVHVDSLRVSSQHVFGYRTLDDGTAECVLSHFRPDPSDATITAFSPGSRIGYRLSWPATKRCPPLNFFLLRDVTSGEDVQFEDSDDDAPQLLGDDDAQLHEELERAIVN